MLKKAFEHWPQGASYHPRSEDELRSYLLIKAGHYEHRLHIGPGPHYTPARSITLAVHNTGLRRISLAEAASSDTVDRTAEKYVKGKNVAVHCYTPKSIAYANMSHAEACKVFSAIDDIVQDVIGVSADDLLKDDPA